MVRLILVGDEVGYRSEIERLVAWSSKNYLYLNTLKAKELVMDFWRNATKPAPFVISGVCVEKVNKIKFQRRCIPENLTRTSNIIILVKKAEQ